MLATRQVAQIAGGEMKYAGIAQSLKLIYREEGVAGIFALVFLTSFHAQLSRNRLNERHIDRRVQFEAYLISLFRGLGFAVVAQVSMLWGNALLTRYLRRCV